MKIASASVLLILLAVPLSACTGNSGGVGATLDPGSAPGKQLFAEHCASCHTLSPGTVLVGPSLAGIATRLQGDPTGIEPRAYLEQSIRVPGVEIVAGFPDVMPVDLGERLSDDQIEAVIDFLMTLE